MTPVAKRRGLLITLILLAFSVSACNPLTVPYFLLVGLDPKVDPECSLKDRAKGLEDGLKVVILASAPLETRPEFIGAERQLVGLLTAKLQESFKADKAKVRVASSSWVQRWLEEHPNWKTMDLAQVGQEIGADIVIDLEVNHLSLYEEGSRNELYRGRADISVKVVDARAPDAEPIFIKEYNMSYPRSRGPVPVTDVPLQHFRLGFLTRIATDLSWYFTPHPTGDEYHCD